MPRPSLEVADILRAHGEAFRRAHAGHLSLGQLKVMSAIEACRTAALGGHVERCDDCQHRRSATTPAATATAPSARRRGPGWLAEREADLLPVPYFHVVFTLPAPLAAIAFQNKAVVYGLLFEAAAETLQTIAADPKHLGARIGFLAVLHTWGQSLAHHPHVIASSPAAGSRPTDSAGSPAGPASSCRCGCSRGSSAGNSWTSSPPPTPQGRLGFFGDLAAPGRARRPSPAHLAPLRRAEWVVYAKPPFGGPAAVLAYLARYTHRIAIANSRLVSMDEHAVRFRWKDYRAADPPPAQ